MLKKIKVNIVKNNKKLYAIVPLIAGYITNSVDTANTFNKVLSSVLIISIAILLCLFNIIGYFGGLYIIKHTNLEQKYPKLKTVIKYYQNTSILFLILEIIFVFSILLIIIGICIQLLYFNENS